VQTLKETFVKTSILGVRVDQISEDELIQFVLEMVRSKGKVVISYVNVHAINIAYKMKLFGDYINHSQVVFCDGYGIKWVAKIINRKKLHRISPPDWFDHLAGECAENGISMFFLGTRKNIIERAVELILEKYPRLNIAGLHHGFFDKEMTSSENQAVLAMINSVQPDILVVGFGMPTQEKWILENWVNLKVRVALPVGAMFDYMAGEVQRAPRWMTNNGLEWLGRLMIEPGRLWKRYIIGNPLFLWRIFIHHILGVSLPK
jgi:N-acetylglucosaminyldiphosphoundecaprenol N-acetyl-beta-D-mannosaminyltransferase